MDQISLLDLFPWSSGHAEMRRCLVPNQMVRYGSDDATTSDPDAQARRDFPRRDNKSQPRERRPGEVDLCRFVQNDSWRGISRACRATFLCAWSGLGRMESFVWKPA